jgi:hypothetical protein
MRDFDLNPPEFEVPHRALRQPVAVNLFKWMVLGDRHVPGQHQAGEVQRAMSNAERHAAWMSEPGGVGSANHRDARVGRR